MLTNLTAIVLHSFMFNDTKMIAEILTETEGRISCVMKIPRTKSRKNPKNLFQPLSILDLSLEKKPASQLATVKEAHLSLAYSSIPFDAKKLAIAFFIAEFLKVTTRNGQGDPLMFRFIRESLLWLDNAVTGYTNFHLAFLIRMTRFIGIYPNLDNYTQESRFDLENGNFVKRGSGRSFLSIKETAIMHKLMRINYNNMHLFRMTRSERNRCLDTITNFYRIHLPDFGELKTLDILREMADNTKPCVKNDTNHQQ